MSYKLTIFFGVFRPQAPDDPHKLISPPVRWPSMAATYPPSEAPVSRSTRPCRGEGRRVSGFAA